MRICYDKLKIKLIHKKMKITHLGKLLGLSPNTIAKINKDEEVSLNVLIKICRELNCDISHICELKKDDCDNEDKVRKIL